MPVVLLIFSPRYSDGLKHIKTLVNDKQGWKQHSQWIKSFKGCIQLVSCSCSWVLVVTRGDQTTRPRINVLLSFSLQAHKHLKGKKVAATSKKTTDPFGAGSKSGSAMTMMQPVQGM